MRQGLGLFSHLLNFWNPSNKKIKRPILLTNEETAGRTSVEDGAYKNKAGTYPPHPTKGGFVTVNMIPEKIRPKEIPQADSLCKQKVNVDGFSDPS
jgi:hypothetical protein